MWDRTWAHLRWVYERTDREYTVAAAEFYEELQPWALAGLALKVQAAIEKKESR